MAIDVSQFQTRDPLTDFSLQIINDSTKFISTEVLPWKYVDKAQNSKYQYDASKLRDVETESSSKSAANRVDYAVFTRSMTTKLHKLAAEVDPRDEAIADAAVADMKFDQAQNIMQRLLIRMERKMVTLVTDATKYPAANTATLLAGSTWLDAGGDPESDSVTASNAVMGSCLERPNAAAMSGTTFRKLRTSPAFKDRIKYTNGGPVPDTAIMAFLGVQKLCIADGWYNSAAVHATDVLTEIWDKSVLFFVQNPNPSLRTLGFGFTWVRKNFYSYEYLDQPRGSGDGRITVLEQGLEYEMSSGIVASSSSDNFVGGYLLKGVVP